MTRAAWLLVALALGCAEKQSERCARVCQREAECAEQLDDEQRVVDKGECVRECNELERTSTGPDAVRRHVDCVNAAPDCEALLACP